MSQDGTPLSNASMGVILLYWLKHMLAIILKPNY